MIRMREEDTSAARSPGHPFTVLMCQPGFRKKLSDRITLLCGRNATTYHSIEFIVEVGSKGELQASLQSLADMFSLSTATMRRVIRRLESINLLMVNSKYFRTGAQSPNSYSLDLKVLINLLDADDIAVLQVDSPHGYGEQAPSLRDMGVYQLEKPKDDRVPMPKPPPVPEPVKEPQAPEQPKASGQYLRDWQLLEIAMQNEGVESASDLIAEAQRNKLSSDQLKAAFAQFRATPSLWGTDALHVFVRTRSLLASPISDADRTRGIRECCYRAGKARGVADARIANLIVQRLSKANLSEFIAKEESESAASLKLHSRRPQ